MPTAVQDRVAAESTPVPDASDASAWGAWMACAQAGDRVAYQALLIGIAPYLRAIARRHLRQEQDAEDMVQEILIVVHDIRHTYEPGRPFKPWLGTIATRRCIDALRQRTRRAQHEQASDEAHEHVADGSGTPEDLLAETQSRRVVRHAVDALPARQREAIQLLRMQGLSLHEAAERSGQGVGSLKVACHRAIKALQRKLAGPGAEGTHALGSHAQGAHVEAREQDHD